MANNTFPENWRDEPCYLNAMPLSLVPYVSGLTKILESRGFWASEADFQRGYAAVLEWEACLMATCLSDLIETQNATYRMLHTALFGQEYETVTESPLVVSPAIAPHVPLEFVNRDSVLGRLSNITDVIDNALNGTETPLYSYTPSVKDLLQQIRDAIPAESTELDDILAQVEIIAGLVG